jgi:hypothetical protein
MLTKKSIKTANALSDMIRANKLSVGSLERLGLAPVSRGGLLGRIMPAVKEHPTVTAIKEAPQKFKNFLHGKKTISRSIDDGSDQLRLLPQMLKGNSASENLKKSPEILSALKSGQKVINFKNKLNPQKMPGAFLRDFEEFYDQVDKTKKWQALQKAFGISEFDDKVFKDPEPVLGKVPAVIRKFFGVGKGLWGSEQAAQAFGKGTVPNFRHELKDNTRHTYIPDIARILKDPRTPTEHKQRIHDYLLAISKHEFMHRKAFNLPKEQVLGKVRILDKLLAPTIKNTSFSAPLITRMANGEGVAQFMTTQGNTRAAIAAIELPIAKLKAKYPELYTQWNAQWAQLPQNMRDRLLATRAHLKLNYAI